MFLDWYFAGSDGRLKSPAGAERVYRWENHLASLWASMRESYCTWRKRELLRQDLERLTPDELADLGLSRADIVRVVKAYPIAGRLHRRMMMRLKLDRVGVGRRWPAVMRALERACIMCGERKQCERWLDAGTTDDSYRAFCPNAWQFAALKTWQSRNLGRR